MSFILLLSCCISSPFCFPQASSIHLKTWQKLLEFWSACHTFPQLNPSSVILTLVHKLFEKRIIEIVENSPSYFLVIARSIEHSWVLLFEESATLRRTIGSKCFNKSWWLVCCCFNLVNCCVFNSVLVLINIFATPATICWIESTLNNTTLEIMIAYINVW